MLNVSGLGAPSLMRVCWVQDAEKICCAGHGGGRGSDEGDVNAWLAIVHCIDHGDIVGLTVMMTQTLLTEAMVQSHHPYGRRELSLLP